MLTVLQEKIAEAHALAMAAATVTEKVEGHVADAALRHELLTLRREAEETRGRCIAYEESLGPELEDEVLAWANTLRERASDLAGAWFKAGTSPLAAWTFLAMGEAAEVAVWRAVSALAAKLPPGEASDLAAWALPVQERHLAVALYGATRLAELADPAAERWG